MCQQVWDSIARELICASQPRAVAVQGVEHLRVWFQDADAVLGEYESQVRADWEHLILDMDGVVYSDAGIAGQIIAGLEAATLELGLQPGVSQQLHERHGGTVLGLLTEGRFSGDAEVEAFYARAYRDVDLSALGPDPLLQGQLSELARSGRVCWWLATNSPGQFVDRVLRALGLEPGTFHVVCPKPSNAWANKPSPRYFDLLPKEGARLFDDAAANCAAAREAGLAATHVAEGGPEVMCLVADELGVVPRSWRLSKPEYLRAKETVDLRSLNVAVLELLRKHLILEVEALASRQPGSPLRVLDLGAGMLSMLPVVADAAASSLVPIHYAAVDGDGSVLEAASRRLEEEFNAERLPERGTWVLDIKGCRIEVELRVEDMLASIGHSPRQPYHLILGCSILDLVDVQAVASALRRWHEGTLLYFPIHYSGLTVFRPECDLLEPLARRYNDSLAARGQVTDIHKLMPLLGETLALESSAWDIAADQDAPLFKQLCSFMATNALAYYPHQEIAAAIAGAESLSAGSAAADGGSRAGATPRLWVENVDFLGRAGGSSSCDAKAAPGLQRQQQQQQRQQRLAVEFSSPGVVRVIEEDVPPRQQGEARVLTVVSAVSAGTERKVLQGNLAVDGEPLDTSLASLSSQQGNWPIRYGYCSVGHVEVGDRLAPGTRVFCFHPHASVMSVAEADVLEIPADIPDDDAVFFANMETACSLVQDAAPVLGDRVAVFGAGVVGSLTAAILAQHRHDVTLFDPPAADRIAAVRAAFPEVRQGAADSADLDLAIEASGSPHALAQAVRGLRRGGRVVVGSWYGEEEVPLPLGLRFHRSEASIVASQVSRIAAPLATRWTKQRRAALAWEMVRQLKPSTWIPTQRFPVERAPDAFAALLLGDSVSPASALPPQVLLTYGSTSDGRCA